MLSGQPPAAEVLIAHAIERASVGDVRAMIAALHAAAAVEPAWSMTAIRIAEIELQMRGGAAARRWLARSDTLDPRSTVTPIVRQRVLVTEAREAQRAGNADLTAMRLRQALALAAGDGDALLDLAVHTGDPAVAKHLLRRSLATRLSAGPLVNLGNIEKSANRLTLAVGRYRQALALEPSQAMAWNNLATTHRDAASLTVALNAYRRALACDPSAAATESNLLQALQFDPSIDDAQLAAAHRRWGLRHAAGLSQSRRPFANRVDPDRRLSVGYVSADLGRHPVGFFLLPIIEAHDEDQVISTCYATRYLADQVSDALRSACDIWIDARRLDDEGLAERIRADGIDILVDLSGHTAHHRLLAFARRPAPIQATWLGYFDTCGLEAIDYLITDVWEVPDERRQRFIEEVVTLPAGRFTYRPPAYAPEPAAPPSLATGRITFGSFNNLGKVTDGVIALWSRVLAAVDGSRLVLKWPSLADPGVAASITERFAGEGIPSDRLVLRSGSPHGLMLAEYGDVDIALDPFPFNGHTTTCDAVWLGLPVVMLQGEMYASRFGSSVLAPVGLEGLIARSPEQYQEIAVELAGDLNRLRALRQELRPRMAASILMDYPGFARKVEASYRQMWIDWCASRERNA